MGKHYDTIISFTDDAGEDGFAAVLWKMEGYSFAFRLKDGTTVTGVITDDGPLGDLVHVLETSGKEHALPISDIVKAVYQ